MKSLFSFLASCIVALFMVLLPFSSTAYQARTRFEPVPTPEMQRNYIVTEATRNHLNEGDVVAMLRLRKQALEAYNAAVTVEQRALVVELYKREMLVILNAGNKGGQVAFRR